MLYFVVATAIVLLVVIPAAQARRRREKRLEEMRLAWGSPRRRDRRMDTIAEYHRARAEEPGAPPSIDDRTWTDLDLDAVFALIDRTESTLGQQALYDRLRRAPAPRPVDAFERLVTRFSGELETRERAQDALARLQNPAGYDLWWLAQPGAIEVRPWYGLFPFLALLMLAAILAVPVWHAAVIAIAAGGVANLCIRAATAGRVRALIGSFRQLGPLIGAADALAFLIADDTSTITAPLGVDAHALAPLRRIAAWVSRDATASDDLIASAFEYLNILFLLDANALYFAARRLRAAGPSLLRLIPAVGEVDAALAVASYRAGLRQWTRPRFLPDVSGTTLADVRHPLVDDAVPNSVTLGPPHGVLITGSNMSGKTTFLRTAGVNAVLAQTINTCLAAAYAAPVFTIYSCIGRADNLLEGKSYYLAEVEAVLALVRASGTLRPHLFLFDELFRGTNAVERVAAGEAVLRHLLTAGAPRPTHLVLAATHDGELVDLLSGQYAAYHFTDRIGPDGLVFDYRLQAGPATTRNAIALLELYGAPDTLVRRAIDVAAMLDRQRSAAPARLHDPGGV
ncbi:MAG TPA: hypothetical protein VFX12_10055 [Vicinamibacterales bacterium]|nr:hypothetical protein [Vicinamibacterales bacterium]